MHLHLSQAFDSYIILQQLEHQDPVRRFLLILPFNAEGETRLKQMTWPWEYSGALAGEGFKERLAQETELFREHVEYELQANGHQIHEVDGRLMCGLAHGAGPSGLEYAAPEVAPG